MYVTFLLDQPSTQSAEISQSRMYARDETVNLVQNLLYLIDLGIKTAMIRYRTCVLFKCQILL